MLLPVMLMCGRFDYLCDFVDYVDFMFKFSDKFASKVMRPPVYLWHYGTLYMYMYVDTYYGLILLSL